MNDPQIWILKTIDSRGDENGSVTILFSEITEITTNTVERSWGSKAIPWGSKIVTRSGREYYINLEYDVAQTIWLEYLKS